MSASEGRPSRKMCASIFGQKFLCWAATTHCFHSASEASTPLAALLRSDARCEMNESWRPRTISPPFGLANRRTCKQIHSSKHPDLVGYAYHLDDIYGAYNATQLKPEQWRGKPQWEPYEVRHYVRACVVDSNARPNFRMRALSFGTFGQFIEPMYSVPRMRRRTGSAAPTSGARRVTSQQTSRSSTSTRGSWISRPRSRAASACSTPRPFPRQGTQAARQGTQAARSVVRRWVDRQVQAASAAPRRVERRTSAAAAARRACPSRTRRYEQSSTR